MSHLNFGRWIFLLLTCLFCFSSFAIAFDFSLCDSPELAMEELGDDYYALCERNVAPDYYSDAPELALQQEPASPQPITPPLEQYPLDTWTDTTPSTFFARHALVLTALAGLALFALLFWLIVWHHHHRRQHKKEAFAQLIPFVKQYVQAGYSLEQIKAILLERGYTSSFINELFATLETLP
jgi:hypothetical protein